MSDIAEKEDGWSCEREFFHREYVNRGLSNKYTNFFLLRFPAGCCLSIGVQAEASTFPGAFFTFFPHGGFCRLWWRCKSRVRGVHSTQYNSVVFSYPYFFKLWMSHGLSLPIDFRDSPRNVPVVHQQERFGGLALDPETVNCPLVSNRTSSTSNIRVNALFAQERSELFHLQSVAAEYLQIQRSVLTINRNCRRTVFGKFGIAARIGSA